MASDGAFTAELALFFSKFELKACRFSGGLFGDFCFPNYAGNGRAGVCLTSLLALRLYHTIAPPSARVGGGGWPYLPLQVLRQSH